MGLPLFETAGLLEAAGVPRWTPSGPRTDERRPMSTEILINASTHEARAAVVENGVLQEVYLERASRRGLISNIYKGRVSRVLPGMQAAFIEIGMERTAFLHASDIFDPRHADTGIEAPRTENIRALVAEGNEILVQVVKDPLGTKGARLTTYITLPSRYLVYMPQGARRRRLGADRARERARASARRGLAGLEPQENAGFIVRTAAEDAPAEALRADMVYLRKLWEFVRQKGLRTGPGNLVHADLPLHLKVLRDMLRHDVDRVLIDQPSAHREMREFAATFMPEMRAADRALRRRTADIRTASRRGGDPESAGPEGVVEVRRIPDHRSDRGDDHDRRQHRCASSATGTWKRRFSAPIWRRR